MERQIFDIVSALGISGLFGWVFLLSFLIKKLVMLHNKGIYAVTEEVDGFIDQDMYLASNCSRGLCRFKNRVIASFKPVYVPNPSYKDLLSCDWVVTTDKSIVNDPAFSGKIIEPKDFKESLTSD